MNLINQYIYKNCTRTTIAIFLILATILLANTGLRLVEDVNEGNIPSFFLLQLLGLKIFQYLSILIPISLFFGIIIALNRLYISNEMVIMKLSGYSANRLSNVLSKLIIFTSLVVMVFSFFLTPITVNMRAEVEHQITHEQKIYSLQEKNFNISNDRSKVIYINDKNNSEYTNIFIKSDDNKSSRIDIASAISFDEYDDKFVTLIEGISYVFNIDGSFSTTKYINQDILLSNTIPTLINNDIESKNIIELFQADSIASLSEALKRFSFIIATLILGYLAIPLSHVNEREDKYKNIFISTLFYFSYIILINVFAKSLNSESSLLVSFIILHLSYLFVTYSFYQKSKQLNI